MSDKEFDDLDDTLSSDLPENPDEWDDKEINLSEDLSLDDDISMDDLSDDDFSDMEDDEFIDVGEDPDSEDPDSEDDDFDEDLTPKKDIKRMAMIGVAGVLGVGMFGWVAGDIFFPPEAVPARTTKAPAPKPAAKITPTPVVEKTTIAVIEQSVVAKPVQKSDSLADLKAHINQPKTEVKPTVVEIETVVAPAPIVVNSSVSTIESSTAPMVANKAETTLVNPLDKIKALKTTQEAPVQSQMVVSKAPVVNQGLTEEQVKKLITEELEDHKNGLEDLKKTVLGFDNKLQDTNIQVKRNADEIASLKNAVKKLTEKEVKVETSEKAAITKKDGYVERGLKRAVGFNVINATPDKNMSVLMTPSNNIIVVFKGEKVKVAGKFRTVTSIEKGGYVVIFDNKYVVDTNRIEPKKTAQKSKKNSKVKAKDVAQKTIQKPIEESHKSVERNAYSDLQIAMVIDKETYLLKDLKGNFIKVAKGKKVAGYEALGPVKTFLSDNREGFKGVLLIGDEHFVHSIK